MKQILLAGAVLLAVAPAEAISRYETARLSCGEAQSRVEAEGAVILRYRSERNPSLPLYDRYVAHGGYCQPTEYAKVEFIPTADTRSCPVYKCVQRSFDGVWPR